MEKRWIFGTNMAKCRICNEEFTEYIDTCNLKKHMAIQHNHHFEDNCLYQYFKHQNNMMKCKLCDREYKIQKLYKIKSHSKQHKSTIETVRDIQREQQKRQDYWWIKYCTLKDGKAQCRFCDKFFYITIYKYHYENHVAIYHIEIYKKIDKKENWIWQYFAFENDKAVCQLCKSSFSVYLQSANIRYHLDIDHKDKMKEKQGQGNEKTNMNSLLASLINDVVQIHKYIIYLKDDE